MDDNGKLTLVQTWETFKELAGAFAGTVSTAADTFPKTFPNEQAKFEAAAAELHNWFSGSVDKLREMEARAEFENNPAQAAAYREFANYHAEQANKFNDQAIDARTRLDLPRGWPTPC